MHMLDATARMLRVLTNPEMNIGSTVLLWTSSRMS